MKKGQTLIEVLVALATSVVIASAIITLAIYSLNNTQFSKAQSLATQYAQEGMEIVRSIRDDDYTTYQNLFLASPVTKTIYCLPVGNTNLVPPGGTTSCDSTSAVNGFIREIDLTIGTPLTGCSNSVDEVETTVKWTDGKCSANNYCHKVDLISCLGKPYVAPTP